MLFRQQKSLSIKGSGMKISTGPIKNRATRVVAASIGVICGLIGIQHGIFEILQGNVPTSGILIDAIGPDYKLWESAREPALSILPNYLITGICAVLIGLLVIVWSAAFIHKKYGALIFFALSVLQLLVGGGITPFELSILASLAAARINRPLTWWEKHLPVGFRHVLARVWLMLLIAFVVLFALSFSITIFGLWLVKPEHTITLLYIMGLSTLGLMCLTVMAGFAKDIEQQDVMD